MGKINNKLFFVVVGIIIIFIISRLPYINLLLPVWLEILLLWYLVSTVFQFNPVFHMIFSGFLLFVAYLAALTGHDTVAEIAGNLWYIVLFLSAILFRFFPQKNTGDDLVKMFYPYRRLIIVTLIYIGVATLIFGRLKNVYFQQDEFYAFGHVIASSKYGISSFFRQSGYHLVPLAYIAVFVVYKIFTLQFIYYAIIAITLHLINSLLVYRLSYMLYPKKPAAFISGLLFLVFTIYQQSVTWYAAIFSILPSALFGILSAIYFIKYESYREKKCAALAMIFWIIGMGFKEDCLTLLPIAIVYVLLKNGIRKSFNNILVVISTFVIYALFRLFTWQDPGVGASPVSLISKIAYYGERTFIIPITGIGQLFASPSLLLSVGHVIVQKLYYIFHPVFPGGSSDLFVEQIFVPNVALALGAIVLLICAFAISQRKKQKFSIPWIALIWSISAISIFIFLPQNIAVESRHYYMAGIGWAILVGSIIYSLYQSGSVAIKMLAVFSTGVILLVNTYYTNAHIRFLSNQSAVRIQFIDQLRTVFPIFPPGSVILASGDPLPIQSGPGQYLMVLYSGRGSYEDFLLHNDLWSTNNGYIQRGVNSFGFFTDSRLFTEASQKYKFTSDKVFGFEWDLDSGRIFDMTKDVRKNIFSKTTGEK